MSTINIDEVTAIGGAAPTEGDYRGRLASVTGAISKEKPGGKGRNPMLAVLFAITEGNHEGDELRTWHNLVVSKGKNGKLYAGGLTDMKKIFAAIGKPLPAGFKMPGMMKGDELTDEEKQKIADAAASLYAKRLHGVDLRLKVVNQEQKTNEDGTPMVDDNGDGIFWTSTIVMGPWKAKTEGTPASKAPVIDPFDEE